MKKLWVPDHIFAYWAERETRPGSYLISVLSRHARESQKEKGQEELEEDDELEDDDPVDEDDDAPCEKSDPNAHPVFRENLKINNLRLRPNSCSNRKIHFDDGPKTCFFCAKFTRNKKLPEMPKGYLVGVYERKPDGKEIKMNVPSCDKHHGLSHNVSG